MAEIKHIILLIAGLLCIGYFYYSNYVNPGINDNIKNNPIFSFAAKKQDVSFKVEDNRIILSNKDTRIVFTQTEPFNVNGCLMFAHRAPEGPFSLFAGFYDIVWGDTAIELALAGKRRASDQSYSPYLSPETRKVADGGCRVEDKYIDDHSVILVVIADNAETDKTLRNIKEEVFVNLKGYKVHLDSINYQGKDANTDISDAVCITEVSIVDKSKEK